MSEWERVYGCWGCGARRGRHWSYLCPCPECGRDNGDDDDLQQMVGRWKWDRRWWTLFGMFGLSGHWEIKGEDGAE